MAIAQRPPHKPREEQHQWVCVFFIGNSIRSIAGVFETSAEAMTYGQDNSANPNETIMSYPLNRNVGSYGLGNVDDAVRLGNVTRAKG